DPEARDSFVAVEVLFESSKILIRAGVGAELHIFCHGCLRCSLDLKRCKGCRMFYYCSTDCQKKDWPLHKTECASCKKHNGVANMYVRFVMRLAAKWAAGDLGEITVDNVVRSLSTLPYRSDAAEQGAHRFLQDYKAFCKKRIVSDDVIERLFKTACVNSFPLLADFNLRIGVSLHIRLSAIDHSCKPNTRYNVDCECEGCLDEERNDRMEGWRCRKCEDGWLPPRINAKCSRCGWVIPQFYANLCRTAENAAKSNCEILSNGGIELQKRLEVARKIFPTLEDALYKFNVLRMACLIVFYVNACAEMNVDDILKYGNELLSLEEQYLNKDDVALFYLKIGLTQLNNVIADQDNYGRLLNGVGEIFPFLDDALCKFNVLRIACLIVFYVNACMEMNVDDILKYGNELLSLEEQYLNKDDIALFYLRIGLTQFHNLVADQDNYVRLLNGVGEATFYRMDRPDPPVAPPRSPPQPPIKKC
ncbi:MYND finger, partial [Teladorsagia circumcincta]